VTGVTVRSLRLLREYSRLEKKRRDSGLSLGELQRWTALDEALRKEFNKNPGAGDQEERRASRRVNTLLSVQFKSLGEARHSLLTNVSRGGVFIYTETPAPIGTRLDIEITIDESGSTILVPAKVASVNVGPDMVSRVQGMGCMFLDMDEVTRKQVDELYGMAMKEAEAEEKKSNEQKSGEDGTKPEKKRGAA
jgi:Tfp pilus assembly protein PilZ